MNNSLPIFADDGISEDGAINIDEVVANLQSISDRCLAMLPILLNDKDDPLFVELEQEASRVYRGLLNAFLVNARITQGTRGKSQGGENNE